MRISTPRHCASRTIAPGGIIPPGVLRFGAGRMFRLTHNVDAVIVALKDLASSKVPQATVLALNDTAYDGLRALQEEMRDEFDRPTRWALNAFMVWRADKRTLTAMVKERPSVGSRHFLKVQGTGGVRPATGLETALRSRLKFAGVIGAAVPAYGAKLDAYGNWSGGERNQALSSVQAQRDATANTTEASRKRNKKRAQYFVPKPGSKLGPGIYRRDGKEIAKVLSFVDGGASYSKRIDWQQTVADRAAQVYAGHFGRHLTGVMR